MSSRSFNNASVGVTYYSHGHVKVLKTITSYTWVIDNFCLCRKTTGEVIDSPIITIGAHENQKWRILLYPKGRDEESKRFVSIYLFLVSSHENELDVQVKFSILNNKKEEINKQNVEQHIRSGMGIGCAEFINRDYVLNDSNGLLPNGHLTILCEIGTGTIPVSTKDNTSIITHELTLAENQLSDDMGKLLEKGSYSDVSLIVGNHKYNVHRNILSARSPVFAALFDKTKNSEELVVENIHELDSEVVKQMLHFIYTGNVNNLSKSATDLLKAAEIYKIDGLKSICEDALCKIVTIDNAIDMLLLADRNKAEKLRTCIIGFMIVHVKDVIETPGYKSIVESQQMHLLEEVFRILALKNH